MPHKVGKYIYGFIESDHDHNFGAIGIGDRDTDVTTIHFKDIAAVVSNYPIVEFDNLEKNKLEKIIAAHQKVNETVMKDHALIPMKFGNIAANEEEIQKILKQAYIQFKSYLKRIVSYAKLLHVSLIIKPNIFGEKRRKTKEGKKVYTLWDVYPHADFITYPSTYEGFGNAFLEAIFFKKPILVNRYSIYQRDIEPLGFDVVTMDTYINDNVIKRIKQIIEDKEEERKMVEKNYSIALKFFSYEVLERHLKTILMSFEGAR